MWPEHCVQNTYGSEFHPNLIVNHNDIIVLKGMNSSIDSYSAFYDNDHINSTTLHDTLQQHNIDTVMLCGLALDYCVSWTGLDALNLHYNTYIIRDACRGITEESINNAVNEIRSNGGHIINSVDIKSIIQHNTNISDHAAFVKPVSHLHSHAAQSNEVEHAVG